MSRQFTYFATLAASTVAIVVLPFPDDSGHGNYATALAWIALITTIACIVLVIVSFFRVKTASPTLEMSLSMMIAPVVQILVISLLGKTLGYEDLSGVTWMGCGSLFEFSAALILTAITVRAIRRRQKPAGASSNNGANS